MKKEIALILGGFASFLAICFKFFKMGQKEEKANQNEKVLKNIKKAKDINLTREYRNEQRKRYNRE